MSSPSHQSPHSSPILGVFDSGVGGLTVLRSLISHLPSSHLIYLGDTARLPYGSKSRETVVRYAVSSARFLVEQGAQMLVIACNTASALALEEIRTAVAPIPVVGVIEPGAPAAAALNRTGGAADVLVLATAATVHSGAYARALKVQGLPSVQKACPLLVPLVEEGWIDHPVTREVVRIYLTEALTPGHRFHTLLLGCTHYPLLRTVFEESLIQLGHPLRLIDSAEATAITVRHLLPPVDPANQQPGTCRFFATDSARRFADLGSRFLGRSIPHVEHVDLGG